MIPEAVEVAKEIREKILEALEDLFHKEILPGLTESKYCDIRLGMGSNPLFFSYRDIICYELRIRGYHVDLIAENLYLRVQLGDEASRMLHG